ncbi:MAG: DUF3810 domain-containing protein [Clostridia bacterium]|nr:DUF3810 domain-containing protein [Clostridia bacterium]
MKNMGLKTKHKLPLACKIIYLLTAVSIGIYIAFMNITPFADWFNRTVSPVGRAALAYLTNWIPFSLTELLLILIPLWLVLLCVIGYRNFCDSWRGLLTYVGILLSGVCVVLIIFVWNFAAGYYGTTLDKKLELDRTAVSADELYTTAEILAEEVKRAEQEILFLESGESVMPYSYAEMNDKLLIAYERLCEKYSFIDSFSSSVKPVMLSEPMSYTHITGVYTFFTGEANINVNFPDYTIPYTAAHELAHQRGIAREDEANFVAFLVCAESDDLYIRYSGYLNTYEYVVSALASANRELYKKTYSALPATVRAEEAAYSKFFQKYKENVAASVSQTVNNSYLQSQGATAGTKSYNMVVDLAVAFYRASTE